MSKRGRILGYGLAGAVVIVGVVCAAVVSGGLGQLLSLVLVSLGLVLVVSLVFLEVGLSEDRERAGQAHATRRQPPARPPRRLDRMRGRARRLK
jgi:hypothetical protein